MPRLKAIFAGQSTKAQRKKLSEADRKRLRAAAKRRRGKKK